MCVGLIALLTVLALPGRAAAEAAPKSPREQLTAVERDPAAGAAKELATRARAAFTRADRLRGVGDAVRAKLVESTAETWTAAAVALTELARDRKKVETAEQKAHTAEEGVSRARAALEASFAREQSLNDEASKTPKSKGPPPEKASAAAPKEGAAPKPKPRPAGGAKP